MQESSKKGKLFLIPTPLVPESDIGISELLKSQIQGLDLFFVERAKTARHFLKKVHDTPIQDLEVLELDKHTPDAGVHEMIQKLNHGRSAGLLSEAGSPAVADPGNLIVLAAHKADIQVIPLIGPSSILLALMASGLNGQNFQFVGYLPRKMPELQKSIQSLEQRVKKEKISILFIETPYRNHQIIEALLKYLSGSIRLCMACNLTSPDEWIKTMTIKQWKSYEIPNIHKIPCMFIIG